MENQPIEQKIERLELMKRQTRLWRTATALVIIVIVVTCVVSVIGSMLRLVREGPEQTEFMDELRTGVRQEVLPQVELVARLGVADIGRAAKSELHNMESRKPELINAVRNELETFGKNLPKSVENVFTANITTMVQSRHATIRKMYPELTEESISLISENLETEGRETLARIFEQTLAPHHEALEGIIEDLAVIRQTEADRIKDKAPDLDTAIVLAAMMKEEYDILEQKWNASAPLHRPPVKLKNKKPTHAKEAK